MDPLEQLLLRRDSFTTGRTFLEDLDVLAYSPIASLDDIHLELGSTTDDSQREFNISSLGELQLISQEAMDQANPFLRVKLSWIDSPYNDSNDLACINSTFKVLGSGIFSPVTQTSFIPYSFICLNTGEDPIRFIYSKYRSAGGIVYNPTRVQYNDPDSIINYDNLIQVNDYTDFIDRVTQSIPDGVKLSFCGSLNDQEKVREIYASLRCLGPSGNMVVKLRSLDSRLICDLLFIACKAFRRLALVKPISMSPYNLEVYAVFLSRVESINPVIDLLKPAMNVRSGKVDYLLQDRPDSFNEYMRDTMNYLVDRARTYIGDAQRMDEVLRHNSKIALNEAQRMKLRRDEIDVKSYYDSLLEHAVPFDQWQDPSANQSSSWGDDLDPSEPMPEYTSPRMNMYDLSPISIMID
uniref:Uncharacterized protein n=1 Tax=viral metagenome TaxID=1070528 RepID=A0A6C0BL80_9ZZZZ